MEQAKKRYVLMLRYHLCPIKKHAESIYYIQRVTADKQATQYKKKKKEKKPSVFKEIVFLYSCNV